MNWGASMAMQGRFAEANSLLGQAVAMHPSLVTAAGLNWQAEAAQGNYQSAIASFDQALKFEPQDAPSWFDGGLALAMLNRPSEAIQYYRQASKFAPDDFAKRCWPAGARLSPSSARWSGTRPSSILRSATPARR